ncbi:GTP pyrophosphokinase [Patescibacteria group bacterium]|nr:GTP pyrophosphokinase [Patescibacteria group bacterium]MBU1123665.1 GTP pyrophosphokinase [Patescibacteria group bacterium]MBU1911573.1 GTP pyrophosphokinase [Patescibacteria group bacterium]
MLPLEKAISIALAAHAGQVDKAGVSYILHPLRIMQKMPTDELMIIAILHDVVEDSTITFDYLRHEGFSDMIISALDAMTKRDGENYEDFIQRVKMNPNARSVKIADIEDNMNTSRIEHPTQKDYERIEKYKKALQMLNTSSEL